MLSTDANNSQNNEAKFLLQLYQKALTLPDKELYNYFLSHAVNLTKSKIGFFHFIAGDQKNIILTTWNNEALKTCTASYSTHYPLEKAGNWADCVRVKTPIIYNDYSTSPNKKGLPEGHVAIKRILSVPIVEQGKVKVIFGVGNKAQPYDEQDAIQLELVANELNKIIKQRKLDSKLRETEERFSKAFHGSPIAMAITRLEDGLFADVNEQFLQLLGYNRKELMGNKITQLNIYANLIDRTNILDIVRKQGRVCHYELDFKTKKGSLLRLLFFAEVINLNHEDHLLTSIIDITESRRDRQKLEAYANDLEKLVETRTKQLKQAERLAAIGATAGMVGHDIRNPLQAIVSDVYLLKDYLTFMPECERKKQAQESLDGIENNIYYINKIVADLQDFAKPLKPILKETCIEGIIKPLLQTDLPENIQASCHIQADAIKIITDADLLRRILCNLITNATQAMPEGGKLSIFAYKELGSIIIAIEDTGVGIPEEVKPNLFTPMFTTKSKGQGFGLAVVKRLTEVLGGTISFESQQGIGTKFTVSLPSV